jgi:hypothetical protein
MLLTLIGSVSVYYDVKNRPVSLIVIDKYGKEMFNLFNRYGLEVSETYIEIMAYIRDDSNGFTLHSFNDNFKHFKQLQLSLYIGLS